MRILWEIFTLVMAIGVLFAISKGFPAFGRVLAAIVFNPIGLLALAGVTIWVIVLRNRAAERKASGHDRR